MCSRTDEVLLHYDAERGPIRRSMWRKNITATVGAGWINCPFLCRTYLYVVLHMLQFD